MSILPKLKEPIRELLNVVNLRACKEGKKELMWADTDKYPDIEGIAVVSGVFVFRFLPWFYSLGWHWESPFGIGSLSRSLNPNFWMNSKQVSTSNKLFFGHNVLLVWQFGKYSRNLHCNIPLLLERRYVLINDPYSPWLIEVFVVSHRSEKRRESGSTS